MDAVRLYTDLFGIETLALIACFAAWVGKTRKLRFFYYITIVCAIGSVFLAITMTGLLTHPNAPDLSQANMVGGWILGGVVNAAVLYYWTILPAPRIE